MAFQDKRFKDVSWKVELVEEAQTEFDLLKLKSKNPKVLQDLLDKFRGYLKVYPPKSPPFGRALIDISDPLHVTFIMEKHLVLRLKAYYDLTSGICYITRVWG